MIAAERAKDGTVSVETRRLQICVVAGREPVSIMVIDALDNDAYSEK